MDSGARILVVMVVRQEHSALECEAEKYQHSLIPVSVHDYSYDY